MPRKAYHHNCAILLRMNILFFGDIFGRPGRETVKKFLPQIKKEHDVHLTIANAENMHHGRGFSSDNIDEMKLAGIDFFTSGNHAWREKSGVMRLSDKTFPVIRPANYPEGTPGRGYQIVKTNMMKNVLVVNLMGRVFMKDTIDCPFRAMDRILKETAHENLSAIFVDFHAETTSEKYALGHYLDGRVSAMVGTHTHVPTRDAHVLVNGTAFISDVGFCGPYDSCIGVDKRIIIQHFLTQLPVTHEVAGGPVVVNAVVVKVDDTTKKAISIEHIQKFSDVV